MSHQINWLFFKIVTFTLIAVVSCFELEIKEAQGRLPFPRWGMHAVYDRNDTIYLFNGNDPRGIVSEVLEYSISKDFVNPYENHDPDLVSQGQAVWTGYGNGSIIYYVGGHLKSNESKLTNEINLVRMSGREFNLEPVAWMVPHCVGVSVVWDERDHIHIIGGKNEIGPMALIQGFDLNSGSFDPGNETGELGTERAFTSSVYNPRNESIYIFGGNEWSQLVQRYHLPSRLVHNVPIASPMPLDDRCIVHVPDSPPGSGDAVYLMGGYVNALHANKAEADNFFRFDLSNPHYSSMAVRNFDFNLHRTACVYVRKGSMSRIYIFGGIGVMEGVHHDEIWYIDVESGDGGGGTTTTTTTTGKPTNPPGESTLSPTDPSTTEDSEPTSASTDPSTEPSTEEGEGSTPVTSTPLPTTEPHPPTSTSSESEPPSTPSPSSAWPSTTTVAPSTTKQPPGGTFDCSARDRYGLLYEADVAKLATNPCPGLSNGTATWLCLAPGQFNGSYPNYSNCSSKWIDDVEDLVEDGRPLKPETCKIILDQIRDMITGSIDPENNDRTYFGHEIRPVLKVADRVLELVENSTGVGQVEELTESTLAIYDKVLTFMEPWKELSERERSQSATIFIASCDTIGIRLGARSLESNWNLDDPSVRYRKSFTGFDEFQLMSGLEEPPPTLGSSGAAITFPEQHNSKKDSFIRIPGEWSAYFPGVDQISFAGFGLKPEYVNRLFPATRLSNSMYQDSGKPPTRIVNGKLMSFTFDDPNYTQTVETKAENPSRVRISVEHDVEAWGQEHSQLRRKLHAGERPKAVSGSTRCVFWDTEELIWSSEGCWLLTTDRDVTVCECAHLTSFAVIMDLHDYVGKDYALELLTLILCPLSIICLLASVLIFAINRHAKKILTSHPRHDLTRNLCLTLLVANVLIVTTMDKHYLHLSDGSCTAAAVVLHYVLLLAFAWMALEGYLLSKLVFLDVFSSGKETAKYEKAGAFLVPGFVVGITCAVNFIRDDHAYGNDAFCWITPGAYLWSFAGVIAPVLAFNTVVLVMSIRKSWQARARKGFGKFEPRSRSTSTKTSARQSPAFWIRGALSLTVIMGLTWVFGFLMLVPNARFANVAAYLFTIANASQGIFIFVFHIASNREVRAHFGICAPPSSAGGRGQGTSSYTSGYGTGIGSRSGLSINGNGVRAHNAQRSSGTETTIIARSSASVSSDRSSR